MKPSISAIVVLASAALLFAADGDRTVVQLHLNRNVASFAGQMIDFGPPPDAKVVADPGTVRQRKVGGLTVSATPTPGKRGTYIVQLSGGANQLASVELTPENCCEVGDRPARWPSAISSGAPPKCGPEWLSAGGYDLVARIPCRGDIRCR
jgi:hypothetical protein